MIVRLSFIDHKDRPAAIPTGAPSAIDLPMLPPHGTVLRFVDSRWIVHDGELSIGREVSGDVVLRGPID